MAKDKNSTGKARVLIHLTLGLSIVISISATSIMVLGGAQVVEANDSGISFADYNTFNGTTLFTYSELSFVEDGEFIEYTTSLVRGFEIEEDVVEDEDDDEDYDFDFDFESYEEETVTETNFSDDESDFVKGDYSVYSSEFIFADSDCRYLTTSEINGLSTQNKRYARNEIYARHGRMFNDDSLQAYFNAKSWYTPIYTASQFDALGQGIFNAYEKKNIELISSLE